LIQHWFSLPSSQHGCMDAWVHAIMQSCIHAFMPP
jgi:hypothetical protein